LDFIFEESHGEDIATGNEKDKSLISNKRSFLIFLTRLVSSPRDGDFVAQLAERAFKP